VSAIAEDVATESLEPGQILALTNWAELGTRVRTTLAELGVPARTHFKEQALRSDEAREALALLTLVCADRDLPALRVLLGLGVGNRRTEAYQRLMHTADQDKSDVWTVLERLAAGTDLGLSVPSITRRFTETMRRVERLRGLSPAQVVDELLPEACETLADLRAVALDTLDQATNACDLHHALLEAVTQDDVPQNPTFVRIMSLHKSKGLTCDCVYVIGAVDGVLPTVRAHSDAAIEAESCEGRRVFYVALTRAARELTIS